MTEHPVAGQPSGKADVGEERTRLRVGLVGFGVAGSVFHAPLIASLPDLELAAVVTSDSNRADVARERYPQAQIVSDVAGLLEVDIDVAVVASPNASHVSVAGQLVERGIATVVDKPLATSSAEARALIAKATRADVLLTCYQNRRWDGDFRTARALVEGGELGSIIRFESRFERWRPQIAPGWKERPDPGSGVLFDLGPHLIDQAIVLFGAPTSVFAEVRKIRAGARVPDSVFLALEHQGGVSSHLSVSAVAAAPGPRFRVLGDQGAYLKHGFDPQELELRSGATPGAEDWGEEPPHYWGSLWQGDEHSPVATQPGDYLQFYRLLVKALRGQGPVPVDPHDCVVALEVIEQAMDQSFDRVNA
jgi:scyllo-inositol 2-dehydrogenase (NADP+)